MFSTASTKRKNVKDEDQISEQHATQSCPQIFVEKAGVEPEDTFYNAHQAATVPWH